MESTNAVGASPTVADVLARLGPGLLRPLTTSASLLTKPLGGISIFDETAPADGRPGDLLLAVGVDASAARVLHVLTTAAELGAAGIVVRTAQPVHIDAASEAQRLSLALLVAAPAPWADLAALLRAALISAASPQGLSDEAPLGDLFGFVNQLAREISGAVTLEDTNSQVLAYSSSQDEVDEPRKQTILGRAVPAPMVDLLNERGVLRALRESDRVVITDPAPEFGLGSRAAVGIRAAGEYLGSIWVAESRGALAPNYREILQRYARTAAVHQLHHRLELQRDHTRTQDVAQELLAGGKPADQLAASAGLRLDDVHQVTVFESKEAVPARARLGRTVTAYWLSRGIGAVTVEQGPRVYSILATTTGKSSPVVATAAAQLSTASGLTVLAAVGSPAMTVRHISRSREEADSALRVLRNGLLSGTVAEYAAVQSQVAFLRLLDFVQETPELERGKIEVLLSKDPKRMLAGVLKAYLEHFGDVRAAAKATGVHPNTFRYRLRRAQEVAGIDLSNPHERVVLALQLHARGSQ